MKKNDTIDPERKAKDILHLLEQREAEVSVINSVQEGIVNGMSMPEIYNLVGDRIRELFDSQTAAISTFDYENNSEYFHYAYEDGEKFEVDPRPIDNFRQHLIRTKEVICINENADEIWTKISGEAPTVVPGTKLTKSVLFVPMIIGDKVRGYISLQNIERENAFSDSDIHMLSTLAKSMSVGLENARLFNETEQRNAELAVINSVQQGLVAEMDMQGIYDLVGERIRELFDSQVTAIELFDLSTGMMETKYLFEDGKRYFPGPEPINNTRKEIIKSGSLLVVNSNVKDFLLRFMNSEEVKPLEGTRMPLSFLFVPLKIGDEVKGVVTLQNLDHENAFSESDVRLLNTLANSMSVALENARLFSETEQRNAELAVINSVQQGLVAEMDMNGIYELVGDRLKELFDAQVTGIETFDLSRGLKHTQYLFEDGKRFYPDPEPINDTRKKLIENKSLLLVNSKVNDYLIRTTGIHELKPVKGTRMPLSFLFVPLKVGEEVKGVVTLQNLDRENAFSEPDVRLLSTLANSMSVALENARLFSETEQKNAELAVINSVQEGLVREMDINAIYSTVGNKICNVLNLQTIIIRTFDHEKGLENIEFAIEDGQRLQGEPQPIIWANRRLIEKKEPLLINSDYLATSMKFGGKGVTIGKPPKSAIFVPMVVGDVVMGSISLQNIQKENAFSDSDVRLLTTLTNSMSVALENARLFNETEQRNAELAVINSVQEGLVAEMDMQGIYDLVGEKIKKLFDSQVTAISTLNLEEKTENIKYLFEEGKRYYPDQRPIDMVREKIIREKKTILVNENVQEWFSKINKENITPVSGTSEPKSALFVPMLVGNSVRGYVALQNIDTEHAFSDSDVRLLNTLVNSMSVALENARLFNETTRLLAETEQRATEMQTVNRISHALVSQLDLKSLIKLIGDQMRKTFNADIVYLALYDRKSNILDFPYMYGDESKSRPFGNAITEKIILSGEPLLVNQDMEKTYDRIEAERTGKNVESYLGVPIFAGKEAIGVISVQSTQVRNRFTENDLRLLKTIAANVGVAMQNAEAYRKLQAALTDLKAVQEQLIQQEKLASLGQLTAGIAHEIKNPLNFVNNFSDLNIELIDEILQEVERSEKEKTTAEISQLLLDVRENLKKIHQHGSRADSIVKSMLQHSRGGSGKVEPTDLNNLVKEYVNLSFHGMRSGKKAINVMIDLQLDEKVGEVPLIAEDFSRVVLNLCNNAFDAMWDKIQVSRAANGYNPRLTVRTFRADDHLGFEIEDNGTGIPEKLREKILQPFFTTKKGTQGTGLGLSITGDIIKAHKGKLELRSTPGKGTCFSISLPHGKIKNEV